MATRADGVTIKQAAQALGITEPAVRQRLQRRTLKSYRVNGKVYVILSHNRHDASEHNGVSNGVSSDVTHAYNALIEQLKAENSLIREQLEIKDRQISELHIMLQTAQRQLPATIVDAPQAPARPAESESPLREATVAPEPSQRESRASWWRRFFLGEQ